MIAVAVAAVFLLYFFGRTIPKETAGDVVAQHEHASTAALNVEQFRNAAVEQLTETENKEWQSLQSADQNQKALFWSSIDRNDVAATYRGEIAKKTDTFAAWNEAGDLYVRSYREVADSSQAQYFLSKATESYEHAVRLEENNETKIKLAKLHTDVHGDVMKGVMLLQQVVASNPNHIQANYELGLLSIRSGQNEKALERFTTVIREKPDFIEPYVLKAQLFMQEQRKDEALATLDEALSYADDQEKEALAGIKKNIINN